jgi:hypothetical protein
LQHADTVDTMKIPFRRRKAPTVVAAAEPVLAPEQRRRVIEYGDAEPEPMAVVEDEEEPASQERLGPMSGW